MADLGELAKLRDLPRSCRPWCCWTIHAPMRATTARRPSADSSSGAPGQEFYEEEERAEAEEIRQRMKEEQEQEARGIRT